MTKYFRFSFDRLWQPTDRQLRQFGFTALVVLPLLAWFGAGGDRTWTLGAVVIGGLVATVGLVHPRSLRPLFITLGALTCPLRFVVWEIFLGLLFLLVLVPIGLVLRRWGQDPLQRQFDPVAKTYWQARKQPAGVASYFRRW